MAATPTTTNTNPLDFPRYVRSLRPSFPESLPTYVEDELGKVSQSLQVLEEATNNFATARVEEERVVRVSEDEALAARLVTVQAEFNAADADILARIATEEVARSTADEALASRVTTVEATFNSSLATTIGRITTEELARATADEALASRIDTVESTFQTTDAANNARVMHEIYTRTTADTALATRIDTVEAAYQAADTTIAASVTAESTARASADSAMASQITTLNTNVGTNTAAISAEVTARTNADTAIAGNVTTLSTTVSGHTATLTTYGTSISGLQARYGVTLNVNGHITGFSQNNSGTTSDFTVVTDNFKIVQPGGTGSITPFEVSGGNVRINGNLVVNGTITSTQIADDAVITDKLADNAATQQVSAYSSGDQALSNGTWVTTQSVSLVCTGGPVVVIGSHAIFISTGSLGQIGCNAFRITRNGSVLYDMGNVATWRQFCNTNHGGVITDNPGAGTHTYEIQAQTTTGDTSVARMRSLVAMELKR